MSQGFLGLSNDDFWSKPTSTFDAVIEGLYKERFQGILLDGPTVVRMDQHSSLPLGGVRVAPTRDAHLINLKWCACLVIVNMDTNEVYAAPGFTVKGARPEVPTESMIKEFAWEYEAQRYVTDARQQCENFPWRPGRYSITLLLLNLSSNSVRTRLLRQEVKDDAVAAFLENRRKPSFPKPVWPPRQAGQRVPVEDLAAPEIPTEIGIHLAVERVVLMSEDARCVVRGSCRLKVLRREIVNKPAPMPRSAIPNLPVAPDVGDPNATAVVPITLVLVTELQRDPKLIRMSVPMYTPIEPGDFEPIVEGIFSVDLLSIPELFPMPFAGTTTYFVRAVYGENISNPVPMALVGEDMLLPG